MSKFFKVSITFICCVILYGCSPDRDPLAMTNENDSSIYIYPASITVDNITPLECLLNHQYELCELQDFFGDDTLRGGMIGGEKPLFLCFETVDLSFPVQSFRYHKNVHYSVYSVKEGGHYFVFWQVPTKYDPVKNEKIIATSAAYINTLPSHSLFNNIAIGKSNAQDLLSVDKNTEFCFFKAQICSFNLLDDGRVLEAKYTYGNLNSYADLIIDEIAICQKEDTSSKLAAIFSRDLP